MDKIIINKLWKDERVSVKIARLESLLITNKKFSKKWLKMLNKHENGCPCKRYGYTDSSRAFNENIKCPFDIKKLASSCFSCRFSTLLCFGSKLRYFHLIYAIKDVLGKLDYYERDNKRDSFFSSEL